MKAFIKRYPSKGELPQFKDGVYQGYFHTEFGLVKYCKYDGWKLARKYPDYFLEEIELPNEEDIRREALGPFKEKDLEDQYGDFIQDDIDTFTKGANYIINLLRTKTQ